MNIPELIRNTAIVMTAAYALPFAVRAIIDYFVDRSDKAHPGQASQ